MHIPDQESRGHISPVKTYAKVFLALLALTAITVAVSYIHYPNMLISVAVAMIIATIKASFVLLYFMHMKYESKLIWGFGIIYPVVLFGLLVGLSSIDVFLRVIPQASP